MKKNKENGNKVSLLLASFCHSFSVSLKRHFTPQRLILTWTDVYLFGILLDLITYHSQRQVFGYIKIPYPILRVDYYKAWNSNIYGKYSTNPIIYYSS